MFNKKENRNIAAILFAVLLFSMYGPNKNMEIVPVSGEIKETDEIELGPVEEKIEKYTVHIEDEGKLFFNCNGYGYRYGPSIIKYEDGSMDAWFSSPGNNSTQWDWITYSHSDDGLNWSKEKVVLKPTRGSSDQCSVCDPGVIYFNGYYYLGYTSTSYYEGNGTNNMAFVARSTSPDGPYEKWNGSSWGGNPEPIIEYNGDIDGWGIGEPSFVIKENELYIYYTYYDLNGGAVILAKADLSENWPSTIEEIDVVCERITHDSMDVVYADDLEVFLGFSIMFRMTDKSKVVMLMSKDGEVFQEVDTTKGKMEPFAHNLGISKSPQGHIDTSERLVIGYGFGEKWGVWSARIQEVKIDYFLE